MRVNAGDKIEEPTGGISCSFVAGLQLLDFILPSRRVCTQSELMSSGGDIGSFYADLAADWPIIPGLSRLA